MPDDEIPFPSGFEQLREPLRKLDALLAIARRVQLESGKAPPGVVEDFHEVRRQVEKAFVFNFRGIDDRLQDALRKFLKNTRSVDAAQLDQNLERLCKISHSMLNALMIQGAPTLSLEDDLAGTRQEVPQQAPQQSPPAAKPEPHTTAVATQPQPAGTAGRNHAIFIAAAVALVVVVTLAIAWGTGLFDAAPASNNAPPIVVNRPANAPTNAANVPIDTSIPFDAAGAGYPQSLSLYNLDRTINPLDATPESLLPDELPGVMLGLEQEIHLLEPARLKTAPDETRAALRVFAQDVIDSQPAWKESRKPFLDAFVGHCQKRLNLRLYENADGTVLLSDVLFHAGGGQQSLCAALEVLALSARCPIGLYAPNGLVRPVIGIVMRDGIHTFSGETYGLRSGLVPLARVAELVTELCNRLRSGLSEPAARVYCLGVIRNLAGALSVEQARAGLADIDLAWFESPAPDAAPEVLLRSRLAYQLQPVICNALLYDLTGATAAEALGLYRLAAAAKDEIAIKQAVLLLAKRADKGAMLDGEPLALRVGDLLRDQKKPLDAATWYRRALEDHPDDPRPALRLAALQPGAKLDYLREAYARGERDPAVQLDLASALSAAGEDLAALALLDQLCGVDPKPLHVEAAVLTCLALDKPDWAQARIAKYADVADSTALQRLDLICELQRNGLSDRARVLVAKWRESGAKDAFIDGLLKRYGA